MKSNYSVSQLNAAAAAAAAASYSSSERVFSRLSSPDFKNVQASYDKSANGGGSSATSAAASGSTAQQQQHMHA
eukprot:20450-Heterococcus_DN1.PRE.1